MRILPLLGWIALTAGCATNPEAYETKRLTHQVNLANWSLCAKIYKDNNTHTLHVDHQHRSNGMIVGMGDHWAVKTDLTNNNCKMILGAYWLDGGSY